MQKPKSIVYYNQRGPSGNIFYILADVQKALRKENRLLDWNECLERVNNSHSYNDASSIIKEYVILKEEKYDTR